MQNTNQIPKEIKNAIKEYNNLVNKLKCQCNPYNGYICGIHKHQSLAKIAKQKIKLIKNAEQDEEYAYKSIKECEEILGHEVNQAFKIGWKMARVKNKHLKQITQNSK